jgi:hypothetical protein
VVMTIKQGKITEMSGMDELEKMKLVAGPLVQLHQYLWNCTNYVENQEARQSAVATIMIATDKALSRTGGHAKTPTPAFKSGAEAKDDGMSPAYDVGNKRWNYCPQCSTTDINHVSEKGKEYQACFNCRLWLNIDEKTSSMDKGKK